MVKDIKCLKIYVLKPLSRKYHNFVEQGELEKAADALKQMADAVYINYGKDMSNLFVHRFIERVHKNLEAKEKTLPEDDENVPEIVECANYHSNALKYCTSLLIFIDKYCKVAD